MLTTALVGLEAHLTQVGRVVWEMEEAALAMDHQLREMAAVAAASYHEELFDQLQAAADEVG